VLINNISYNVHLFLNQFTFQNPWFKKNRFQQQKAKKLSAAPGGGLGLKERPGLGAKTVSIIINLWWECSQIAYRVERLS